MTYTHKKIVYRKWDACGNFESKSESDRKYTVRGAMAHLRRTGFQPFIGYDPNRRLIYCWTNERGMNAYIL